jgi:hypothetical protein
MKSSLDEANHMKYFFLICLCFGMPGLLCAQSQITGKVHDINGAPLPFASVLLLSEKDSSLVKGVVSESDGSFYFEQVAANDYLLSITSVGFRRYLERIQVPVGKKLLLPPTVIHELEEELEEITVFAQKPLFEKQIDRMVVNVQESITAAGSSVLEVLSRSPGVLVNKQQNSITLNGRDGVMVMINNTLTRMPMESVMQLLEGMSAANVEKIELISQPPSNLDAEGGGGVIHIVMKENTEQGTNGSFGLSAGMKRGEVLGANVNLSHRENSYSLFAEYAFLQSRNIGLRINGFSSKTPSGVGRSFYADTDRSEFRQSHQFRAGIAKTFLTNTELGAYVNLNRTNTTFSGEGETTFQAGDSLVLGDIWYQEFRSVHNNGTHFHLAHQLDAKHRFRMDYDWVNLQFDNPSTYDNTFHHKADTTKFVMDLESHTPMNFHIIALDYQFQPSPQWNIKAGVKKTWMNFENNVQSYSDHNDIRKLNPFISLSALMKENISAAYVSGDWNIGDHLLVKAGLRFEHTETDIRLLEESRDTTIYRHYGNIFPNLLIHKSLSDKSSVTMGYSKRINRPTLGDLVPVVLLINQNTEFRGNPELLPALIDNYKLDFKFNRASLSLEHNYSKMAIAGFQPQYDQNLDLIIMRPENLRFLQYTGLIFTAPWIISANWDLQPTVQLQRRSFEASHLGENKRFSFFDLNLNLVNTFTMGNGYAAELGGFLQTNRHIGLLLFRPVGSLNLGLQKKLKEDRGTLRLAVTDLLNTDNILADTHFPEIPLHTYLDYYLRNRTITVNYSRPFGNKKLKTVKIESASEEDRKRMVVP